MLAKYPTSIPSIITTLFLFLMWLQTACRLVFLKKSSKNSPPPNFLFLDWKENETKRSRSVDFGPNLRKPYLHFCQQLAERLRAQPEVKDSSAMVDLRRFCGGPNGDWNDGESRGAKRLVGSLCPLIAMLGKFWTSIDNWPNVRTCWNYWKLESPRTFWKLQFECNFPCMCGESGVVFLRGS